MVKVPVCVTAWFGVKTREMAQALLPARAVPQGFAEMLKGSVAVALLMLTAVAAAFWSVTVSGVDVDPIAT
jgi:hypothetical protein